MMTKRNVPLYMQLVDSIVQKINKKEYQPEEKLPSERELCDMYGLSRITVRNALQELQREGYIYKVHGKGTFVSSNFYKQNLVKLYSFTEEMKKLGKIPKTKVISFKKIESGSRLAGKMEIKPTDSVYQVVRLRLADDEPLMYETSYIPFHRFPDLTKEALEADPMYTLFYEKYHVIVTKAIEQFSATTLTMEEASYLNITEDSPGMLIKRVAYFKNDIIEYTSSVTAGDKFRYTVELV